MQNKKPLSPFERFFLEQARQEQAQFDERVDNILAEMGILTDVRQIEESDPATLRVNFAVTPQQKQIVEALALVFGGERNIALWNAILKFLGGNTPDNWAKVISYVLMVGFSVDTKLNIEAGLMADAPEDE